MKKLIPLVAALVSVAGLWFDYKNIADPYPSEPAYILGIAVFLPSLLLLFCKEEIFKSWFRFARWALPLSILLIIVAPTTNGSFTPFYGINKEMVTWLMGGLFTLISLILIVWKSFAHRMPTKKNT